MKGIGGKGEVGYVYVAGFAPLDRRNRGWNEVKKANPGIKQVAHFGKVSDSTASDTQEQANAAITANPDIKAVLAPYDEFAKGVVLALGQANKSDVKCSSARAGGGCCTRSAATSRPRGSRACASSGCAMAAYMVSGVLASLGGVILAARIGEGDVGAGNSYLLDAVAAALVGYAVLAVNRPNVLGTAVGAVFLGIMLNGLTIKNFPYYTQDFVKGVVLMVALLLTFGVRRLR